MVIHDHLLWNGLSDCPEQRDLFPRVRKELDDLEARAAWAAWTATGLREEIRRLSSALIHYASEAQRAASGSVAAALIAAVPFMPDPLRGEQASAGESVEAMLKIGPGKKRATLWSLLPERFIYADEARVIDVVVLEVIGEQSVEIRLDRGDMPQAQCSLRPVGRYGLPDHALDSLEFRGLQVLAHQSWKVTASRFGLRRPTPQW